MEAVDKENRTWKFGNKTKEKRIIQRESAVDLSSSSPLNSNEKPMSVPKTEQPLLFEAERTYLENKYLLIKFKEYRMQ